MNLTKQTSIVAAVLAAFTFSLSAQAAVLTSVNLGASGLSNETGFTNTGPATSSTNFALVNGIQVTAVPEPSSFALLAGMLGMVWVMVRRR